MVMQEDLDFTSLHGHTESTATYTQISFGRKTKTSWATATY